MADRLEFQSGSIWAFWSSSSSNCRASPKPSSNFQLQIIQKIFLALRSTARNRSGSLPLRSREFLLPGLEELLRGRQFLLMNFFHRGADIARRPGRRPLPPLPCACRRSSSFRSARSSVSCSCESGVATVRRLLRCKERRRNRQRELKGVLCHNFLVALKTGEPR